MERKKDKDKNRNEREKRKSSKICRSTYMQAAKRVIGFSLCEASPAEIPHLDAKSPARQGLLIQLGCQVEAFSGAVATEKGLEMHRLDADWLLK